MPSGVKSFHDLIEEAQKPGSCGRCGGCVSFCSADNLGALKVDEDGMPLFADEEKCLRCGICYTICPNTRDLDDELKEKLGWKPPIGPERGVSSSKATDPTVTGRCSDGGVFVGMSYWGAYLRPSQSLSTKQLPGEGFIRFCCKPKEQVEL